MISITTKVRPVSKFSTDYNRENGDITTYYNLVVLDSYGRPENLSISQEIFDKVTINKDVTLLGRAGNNRNGKWFIFDSIVE